MTALRRPYRISFLPRTNASVQKQQSNISQLVYLTLSIESTAEPIN